MSAARLAAAGLLLASGAAAAGSTEEQFWPEFDAFFKLDERTRVFLVGALTRAEDADTEAGDPRYENGKLGAHLDISLQPVLRPRLDDLDWEKNRYLWMRIGYNYVGNYRADGDDYHEDRGILELSLRQPAVEGLTITGRLKWDLRNIDGNYSNRYRVRAGLEWATQAGGHALAPYAHVEASYDTRFDAWNRQRYQAGVEVALNSSWRIEPYVARQDDSRSSPAHVNALGLIFKYYH
jgi:hypothetical protein